MNAPSGSTIEVFSRQVAAAFPPQVWLPHRVLVAVSGGPDSMALLRSLHWIATQQRGAEIQLAVAHLNHGLRGEESNRDQEFVESLAGELSIPVFSERLNGSALGVRGGDGIESAARQARYNAFSRMAHQWGARYLATGHTFDDQVETIVFRIFRGTGIAGLAGIPLTRPIDPGLTLVRPLLGLRRSDVSLFLAALGQAFRDDTTNQDATYAARNWIRNELLPLLRSQLGPQVDGSLGRLASVAGEHQQFIRSMAEPVLAEALVEVQSDHVVLRRAALEGRSPILVRAALQLLWERQGWPRQEMGYDQWQRLDELALGVELRPESYFPGPIRATRVGDALHLTRIQLPEGLRD